MSRAWVDDDDDIVNQELAPFHKAAQKQPTWATRDGENESADAPTANTVEGAPSVGKRKLRGSSDDDDDSAEPVRQQTRTESHDGLLLDALLSTTAPVLSSKHDAKRTAAPKQLSVFQLPRDTAKAVCWHRNGQLAVIGGSRSVYTFHSSGKFVEQISKVDANTQLEGVELTSDGEEAVFFGKSTYTPALLSLATERQVPLRFLDTRNWSVHRNGRKDNSKRDYFISQIVSRPNDGSARVVAVASGSTVTLGSLSTGTIMQSISTPDVVSDVAFSGTHEMSIVSGNRVLLYDVRKTAQFVRSITDESLIGITKVAFSPNYYAVGLSSGVVSVYSRSALASSASSGKTKAGPIRSLMNLTTSISSLSFGEGSEGTVLAFSTGSQKSGFRVARLPECRVVPSFPAVSSSHGFVTTMAIASTVPVLSVGEKGRVTNYAI